MDNLNNSNTKTVTTSNLNSTSIPQKTIKRITKLGFPWETSDPFLFCVHHHDFYPKGNANLGPDPATLKGRDIGHDFTIKDGWRMYHGSKVPGFPGHPHCGFETVTIVRKGMVDHSDSLGGAGRYGDGDVQWLTTGKGVQHSEMFPLLNKTKENTLELFQIWLNLPKSNKYVDPHYKMFWSESVPVYEHSDSNGKRTTGEVIAGSLGDKVAPLPPPDSWASDPENDVAIWYIEMESDATWTLPKASPGLSRILYFFKGDDLKLGDTVISPYNSADLISDHSLDLVCGKEKAYILVLQGKPISEPVVQHGPFVMNTQQEIRQAFDKYSKTHFGGWPWPSYENLHPKNKGRFARYSKNGDEDTPTSST